MAAAVDSRSVIDLRESEIENLHAALGEQNVAGLQVAVDDALFGARRRARPGSARPVRAPEQAAPVRAAHSPSTYSMTR